MRVAARMLNVIPERTARGLATSMFMRPIFIVGTNKVGKSLLGQALKRHSGILTPAAHPEVPALAYFGELVHRLEPDPEATWGGSGVHSPRSYMERSFGIPREQVYGTLRRICFELAIGPRYGVAKVVRKVVDERRTPPSYARWCVEVFPQPPAHSGLLKLYPEARFIYVMRNGIDAVQARIDSVLRRTGRRPPFEFPCRQWAKGIDIYHYLHEATATRVVRFEELKARPHEVLEQLFAFLDVPQDVRSAEFLSATLGDSAGLPAPSSSPQSPLETWASEERAVFLEICGDAMQKAGYEIPS